MVFIWASGSERENVNDEFGDAEFDESRSHTWTSRYVTVDVAALAPALGRYICH